MSIFSLGVNHQTAPLAFREKVASVVQNLMETNRSLTERQALSEIVTISTCNRVEFYCVCSQGTDQEVVFNWLNEHGISTDRKYFYWHTGQAVIRHLFRVVSSLDSMILGENQIVSQVRSAFHCAEESSSVGPILRRIFEKSFVVAKKIRTETKISEGAVSIGRAGVDLSRQVLGDISNKTAMIIGAGEHGQLIAKNLRSKGLSEIYVANRTFERAVTLAQDFAGFPIRLSDIPKYLERCDVIVSSIGGGECVIHRKHVDNALKIRRYKPLVFIDLSVPRVFDVEIHDLNDAYLFDVDDLQSITAQGAKKREQEAQTVENIVQSEVELCWDRLFADQHNQSIGAVFQNASVIVEQECHRLGQQVELTEAEMALVKKSMNSIVKKILHHPVRHAQNLAKTKQSIELQEYLSTLIDVDIRKPTKD